MFKPLPGRMLPSGVLGLRALVVGSVLVALSSCTYVKLLTQQPEITYDARLGAYSFVGPINFGTAERLRKEVPDGSKMIFQSFGGRSEEAQQIARWMKSHRITLTIRGYCVSSCANYVSGVPGAQWGQPAILLFHGGGQSTYIAPCADLPGCRSDPPSDRAAFAREFGLNPNFVVFSGRAVESVFAQRAATDGARRLPGLPLPYFWAPSREELKCFGVEAEVSSLADLPISDSARKWYFTTAELSPALQQEFGVMCAQFRSDLRR